MTVAKDELPKFDAFFVVVCVCGCVFFCLLVLACSRCGCVCVWCGDAISDRSLARRRKSMRVPAAIQRRSAVRTALLAAAAAYTSSPSKPALAWCGERFPSWAYYLKWDQVDVPFEYEGKPAGTVSYRIVGDKARESSTGVPPVLVCGTPGLGYEYMENMEALTVSDRRVVEVTFSPTAPIESGGIQLASVCKALGIPVVHVVAHGLGAVPALSLVGASGSGSIRSLTLISPYGALSDLREDARASVLASSAGALAAAPAYPPAPAPSSSPPPPPSFPGMQDCSQLKTEAGRAYCDKENAARAPPPAPAPPPPAPQLFGRAALLPTVSGNARGTCVAEAQDSVPATAPVLGPLLAQSTSQESLRLGGGQLSRKLGEEMPRTVPVCLMAGGARDIVDTDGWGDLPNSVKRVYFPTSGHMPLIEARDDALGALLEFLDAADGKQTNREFKFADPIKTVKELL